jgi:hypothetical protein
MVHRILFLLPARDLGNDLGTRRCLHIFSDVRLAQVVLPLLRLSLSQLSITGFRV